MKHLRNITSGTDSAPSQTHHLIQSDNQAFLEDSAFLGELDLLEGVDTLYLDPPYNTGNTGDTGFSYHDKFGSEAWVEMIEETLLLALPVLKQTGVVVVSIDDSEVHTLRVIMDRVFGKKNFIAQLTIDGGANKNNSRFFSVTHEYMLVYAKNLATLSKKGQKWRREREGASEALAYWEKLRKRKDPTTKEPLSHEQISALVRPWLKEKGFSERLQKFYESDDRGLYTYADLSVPGNRYEYNVYHPVTGLKVQEPSRGWGLSEQKFAALHKDDQIIWGADETYQPLKKVYLTLKKDQLMKSVLSYPSRSSTHLLERLLGRRTSFNNPKNLTMMKDILDYVTPDNGTVMDFYGGSGTTLHAVMELNSENDDSTRKCVLVTNNENNIFVDVTEPRVKAVHEKLNLTCQVHVYENENQD